MHTRDGLKFELEVRGETVSGKVSRWCSIRKKLQLSWAASMDGNGNSFGEACWKFCKESHASADGGVGVANHVMRWDFEIARLTMVDKFLKLQAKIWISIFLGFFKES